MPRRILALWLPTLPTDRLHRRNGRRSGDRRNGSRKGDSILISPCSSYAAVGDKYTVPFSAPISSAPASAASAPLAVMAAQRGRMNLVARGCGWRPLPGLLPACRWPMPAPWNRRLQVVEADPVADARALAGLADWCGRYTPWTATHGDDCILLDITGCAHLFGGEAGLARDLIERLTSDRLCTGCLAVADTPGSGLGGVAHGRRLWPWPGAPLGDALIPPGRMPRRPWPGCRSPRSGSIRPRIEGLEQGLGLRRIGDLIRPAARQPGRPLRAGGAAPPRPGPGPGGRAGLAAPAGSGPSPPAWSSRGDRPHRGCRPPPLERLLDQALRRAGSRRSRAPGGSNWRSTGSMAASTGRRSAPAGRAGARAICSGCWPERLDRIDAGFGIEVAVTVRTGGGAARSLPRSGSDDPGVRTLGWPATIRRWTIWSTGWPAGSAATRWSARCRSKATCRNARSAMRPAMDGPTDERPTRRPHHGRTGCATGAPAAGAGAHRGHRPGARRPAGAVPPRIGSCTGSSAPTGRSGCRRNGGRTSRPAPWPTVPATITGSRTPKGRRFWLYRAGLYRPQTPHPAGTSTDIFP